jgi:hypothetical protein
MQKTPRRAILSRLLPGGNYSVGCWVSFQPFFYGWESIYLHKLNILCHFEWVYFQKGYYTKFMHSNLSIYLFFVHFHSMNRDSFDITTVSLA